MKKYPIAKPSIGRKEEVAVLEVLRSGVLSIGPKLSTFETNFAKYVGTKYAVGVSSGTAGLHMALLAAGIGPGDEVITSPFSFIASANAILYVGATPVFVDIDPITYNIDVSKIEKAITKKTKAILPVHIFGQSADMAKIMKIARKYKLNVIEDACESLGAKYKNKMTGTFGESAVFAFYPNKQMTTGEGGMIVTDSKQLYEQFLSLRNQGRGNDMQWLSHVRLGYNYRLDEMSAALGVVQLERLPKFIEERIRIAKYYSAYLGSIPGVVVPNIALGNTHSWFVYVVQLPVRNSAERDQLILDLAKAGIASKPYLPSIHLTSYYQNEFGYKKGMFPISETTSDRAIALPFYVGLKKDDVKYIVEKLVQVIKKN